MVVTWWQVALGAFITAALALIGSVIVGKMGRNTNKEANVITAAKNASDADVSAGQLALSMAKESKQEVAELREWQRVVRVAWREHEAYDDLILDKLEELAPGTKASLPPRPPLPID